LNPNSADVLLREPPPARSTVRRPGVTLAVLCLAALVFALAQTSIAPAIGQMAEELGTSSQTATWSFTGYLVSAAVLTPVIGRFGDMFGKKRMLLIVLITFAAGGALAALGSHIALVIVGRVIQGIGGGVFPLCFGIIREQFPERHRASAIGAISSLAGLGAGIGLLLGGVIIDHAPFTVIFWTGSGMATLAALCLAVFVAESAERLPSRIDFAGLILLSLGLISLMLSISQVSDWGVSDPRTLILGLSGLTVLFAFGLVERRVAQPLLDLRLLARPAVLLTNVATFFIGFGAFAIFLLTPQYAQTPLSAGYGFGSDATGVGLLMLPSCVLMMLSGPLSGSLSRALDSRVPLILGGIVVSGGMCLLGFFHDREIALFALTAVVFVGIGLAFAAVANLIVEHVPSHATGEATGVNALLRALGNALGIQVASGVLNASVVAGSTLPSDHAFSVAFMISAMAGVVSVLTALSIPHARRTRGQGSAP
jgi:MFS family permease